MEGFVANFINITGAQRLIICQSSAYPDNEYAELQPVIKLMRNLTMTGYYTTELGFNYLGYVGNTLNVWGGVPDNVL